MREILDLHVHSRFSRATSKDMNIEGMAERAKKKGITILGTGDITHPEWMKEVKKKLVDLKNGLFEFGGVKFILSGEINIVFNLDGKLRKIHVLLTVPSFDLLDVLNAELLHFGDLLSDGRPTIFISGEKLLKLVSSISDKIFVIPAHIWTPWFGLFGSKSGFDRIADCFGDETYKIFALETGLSSDPYLNYLVRDIDRFTVISNSDAHSLENLGREANVMENVSSYEEIFTAIKNKDRKKFLFTIEFFPEEGKYFGDGHRKCGVHFVPECAEKVFCPVCGKPLTYGVFHRVMDLAGWKEEERSDGKIPFIHVIPLKEILSQVFKKGKGTKVIEREYLNVLNELNTEIDALVFKSKRVLFDKINADVAKAIVAMRSGNVVKQAGYDGEYGKLTINMEGEQQVGLFN
jgi:uncharacterized protein (TIGR00375 family)